MNTKEPYAQNEVELNALGFTEMWEILYSGGWQLVLFTFYKNLVISAKCWEKCFELTNDNSVKRLTRNCVNSAEVGLVHVCNNWDNHHFLFSRSRVDYPCLSDMIYLTNRNACNLGRINTPPSTLQIDRFICKNFHSQTSFKICIG
jgi:hypothetical protein